MTAEWSKVFALSKPAFADIHLHRKSIRTVLPAGFAILPSYQE